jgi:hypothetical protein
MYPSYTTRSFRIQQDLSPAQMSDFASSARSQSASSHVTPFPTQPCIGANFCRFKCTRIARLSANGANPRRLNHRVSLFE